MNNFVTMISGTSYDKNDITKEGLRVLRGGNIQSFKLLINNDDVFLPLSYLNKNALIQKNDILLVASTGSKEVIGKPAFVEDDYPDTTIGAFLRIVRAFSNECFDYLKVIFMSTYYRTIVRESVRGTNINNLKANTILDMYVPLPSLKEQLRIVSKINSFEPLLTQYSIAEEKLSILEDEFPEKLKKSILQYAIEGKLVKQDPNDEPASVLLERIKAEKERLIKEGKIKRDKNESYIYQGDDKNYYENLPSGWAISYLKNICKSINAGGDKPKNTTPNKTETNLYPVIANGLHNDGIVGYSSSYEVDEECLTLSGRGTIGFPIKRSYKFTPIVRLLVIKPLLSFVETDFLSLSLSVKCNRGVGTSVQQLTVPMITNTLIELPPYKEQIRISKKVSRLFKEII